MRIPRIDSAIETCREHLQSTDSQGTEVEAYLTRYLLVFVCATFEEEIKRLITRRVMAIQDEALQAFFSSCMDAVFRSIKTSEIAGLLKRFGLQYKRIFLDKLEDRVVTFFNNIVTNRHGVAHTGGANITFSELGNFYDEGHAVLDALKETLDETIPTHPL